MLPLRDVDVTAARLVVLASGAGTTLQAILDAAADPAFGATVVAVGTDRHGSLAQERAQAAGVATWVEELASFTVRSDFDAAVAKRLDASEPTLVVLAGYMKILGPSVVRRFKIVNTHAALLPQRPGAHPIRLTLEAGDAEGGATVHWVDEGMDTGPIIAQVRVPVLAGDTEDTLRERVQAIERPLYVQTIGEVARQLVEGTT